MDSDKQRILGYFIEEAKEHLDTLEKGLMDLQSVVADQESANEMFRAAHSVKGGAAMLGFNSIQKIAHRFEDCFKIIKEHPVKVDQKLESMFLDGYDTLKALIEGLQRPFGLRDEEAEKMVQEAEPTFVQIQDYLNSLLAGNAPPAKAPSQPQAQKQPQKAPAGMTPQNVAAKATGLLKQMLELFKQKETAANRQQLLDCCDRLKTLGVGIESWGLVVQTAQKAIANPKNPYRALAPIAIKELKQASELLAAGKAKAIAPSPTLRQLAAAPAPAPAPAPATAEQITCAVEPKAAAKAMIQAFNKQQLRELVLILHKACS